MPMDRPCLDRVCARLSLMLAAPVLARRDAGAPGARSPRQALPDDGRRPPSVGFSNEPHPQHGLGHGRRSTGTGDPGHSG